jgi:predicted TIM-barrel fold metal-dependent hydrolase
VRPSTIGMVTADAHVNEPRDLWSSNLPTKLRDQAMHGIQSTEDGGWEIMFEGFELAKRSLQEEERLRGTEVDYRLKMMAQEGIAGEIICPTIGLYVWMLKDPEGGRISCRIYNDWILDTLESRSPRFRCVGIVPTWDVKDAIAEVQYISSIGLAGVMLPVVGPKGWNHRDWEPLWSAIEETGLTVSFHQGSGHDMIWYRGPGATIANLVATQSIGPRTATMLATSGVLERHPGLHFVFIEFNTGWLAWSMSTADYYTDAFARYGTTVDMDPAHNYHSTRAAKPAVWPALAEPPSHYMRSQIHSTFQDDPVGMNNIPLTGPECVLFGADYPHEEGTFPHTRSIVDGLSEGFSDDVVRKVFRNTAGNLFGFDMAEISPM